MGWFSILTLVLATIPQVTKVIQTVIGDKQSGADKKKIATDALNVSIAGADNILTGSNKTLADIFAPLISLGIDQAVAIQKADGTYAKATEIAKTITVDTTVAGLIASPIAQLAS